MNPEVKIKLLEALRSGEYEKGSNCLAYRGDQGMEYCCLGVLSVVAHKDGICGPFEPHRGSELLYGIEDDHAYPPLHVADWAGLSNDDMITLASINDESSTFDEVIEHIETNL